MNINSVLDDVRARGLKFIQIWFSDILGTLKSFTIPAEKLPRAFENGLPFDGSSIEGFARMDESDMLAWPDPSTFALLPGADNNSAARMFADIKVPDGTPFEGDPRHVLKRALERMRDLGFTNLKVGPEIEYFYLRSPQSAEPLDRGGYFDAVPRDEAIAIRRETARALEGMGIGVESAHHEGAWSQHEIDLSDRDALQMADTIMTARFVVKQIASQSGVYATFMPKPINGQNGSGLHLHLSMLKGSVDVFHDPKDRLGLSEPCRRFIAGLMKHSRELCLLTNPTVNSYKRLIPGFEAPVYVTWARRNRGDLIRVPLSRPGTDRPIRVELRSPDPSCNPYLAIAAVLSAGLEGIEKGLELSPPVNENVNEMSPSRRSDLGVQPLPGSLIEAIQESEKSDLLRRTLGTHVFTSLLESKRVEWERFRTCVTALEVETYLPIL